MLKSPLNQIRYVPWLYRSTLSFFAMIGVSIITGLIFGGKNILSVTSGILTMVLGLLMVISFIILYIKIFVRCKKIYKYLLNSGKQIDGTIHSVKNVLSTTNVPLPDILELEVRIDGPQKLHFVDYFFDDIPKLGEKVIAFYDPNDLEISSLKKPFKHKES